jgi:3-oxoacyl-[acyl-carrier protein] reductase
MALLLVVCDTFPADLVHIVLTVLGIISDMFYQNAWHYIPGATPDFPANEIKEMMAGACPLKRCAQGEDVGRVVGFLASEDGGWVNGQIITISGGSSQ